MRACEQTEGVFYQGRMNNMYLAQMLTAAAKYGFPIIVSCYLLVREEEVNSKNRHSTKDCGRGYNISVVIPLTFVWFCSTISVVSL